MVGHGFLFSLPHSFFAAAECVASSQKSENEALTATLGVEGYVGLLLRWYLDPSHVTH